MGIEWKSGVGEGESGDRYGDWGGKRLGMDRRSGVGEGESGDRSGVGGVEWG